MKPSLYFPFRLLTFLLLTLIGCKKESNTDPTTVTDIDGNVYHTVTIGTQVWMVENLKTTKYRNGDPIPNVTLDASWTALTSGAYCLYNNDAANKITYGALYNWFAVSDSRNIAPVGWHVPTDAEWTTLTDYLGGTSVAGGKLKESGTSHWITPNTGATNSNSFTALPGGFRGFNGAFNYVDYYGFWWPTTNNSTTYAWFRYMSSNSVELFKLSDNKYYGFSVRCLKD